ncbi:MAG TPA: AraC family transcriptional regulator [Planctomycetota bacterium]|nr:AraC family transcriptional regulator [Planctomycetota bacterium]
MRLPPPPWSPWLRLAHVMSQDQPSAAIRRIRDFELVLITEGSALLWWEPAGGTIPLATGDCLLLPPRVPHAFLGGPGMHLAVHFDFAARPAMVFPQMLDFTDRWVERADIRARPQLALQVGDESGAPVMRVPLVSRLAPLATWIDRFMPLVTMYQFKRMDEPLARLQSTAIITGALHDMIADAGSARVADGAGERVAAMLATLEMGARRWTVGELAARADVAASTFRSTVLALTGESPHAWLERKRLEHALHLLGQSDLAIAAVATRCGYADAFHFSRVCRRRTRLSPKAARAALLGGREVPIT